MNPKPIKLLFAGGKSKYCVAAAGELAQDAVEDSHHIEDVFYDGLESGAAWGLSVFEGESWWTSGGYEYPDDCDFLMSGTWRRATAAEIMRLATAQPVWPGDILCAEVEAKAA